MAVPGRRRRCSDTFISFAEPILYWIMMNASLWNMVMPGVVWAVCDGSGPVPIRGFIVLREGKWCVYEDRTVYPDFQSAVRSLGYVITELRTYVVEKHGEVRTVITYDQVIEELKREGWFLVTQHTPFFTQNSERYKTQAAIGD